MCHAACKLFVRSYEMKTGEIKFNDNGNGLRSEFGASSKNFRTKEGPDGQCGCLDES